MSTKKASEKVLLFWFRGLSEYRRHLLIEMAQGLMPHEEPEPREIEELKAIQKENIYYTEEEIRKRFNL